MTQENPKRGNSRQIISSQCFVHPRLPALVNRHLAQPYRKPMATYNLRAFSLLQRHLLANQVPLVLDSFCGTGYSTEQLAYRHPDHFIVGVDKSARRLSRHGVQQRDNYLLLRADCEAIWQLLAQAGIRADYHYLLYPNPWPKPGHLARRVHGHGSFPYLLQLAGQPSAAVTADRDNQTSLATGPGVPGDDAGVQSANDTTASASPGRIILRSNWQTYVEEFGVAAHLAGRRGHISMVSGSPALTLFERKYHHSAHTLWQYSSDCSKQ